VEPEHLSKSTRPRTSNTMLPKGNGIRCVNPSQGRIVMTILMFVIGILCAVAGTLCLAGLKRPLLVLSESDENAIRFVLRSGAWFYVF
jgi:hypothetical protein